MRYFIAFFLIIQFLLINNINAQKIIELLNYPKDIKSIEKKDFFFPYEDIKVVEVNSLVLDSKAYNIGDKILVELFGEKYMTTIDRIDQNINKTLTIRARFDKYPKGYVILSETDGLIIASIRLPGKNKRYSIKKTSKSGKTYLKRLDIEELNKMKLECGTDFLIDDYPDIDNLDIDSFKEFSKKESKSIAEIGVMIVYTPLSALWAKEFEGSINNTIAQSMAKAQLAMDNSDTNINMTLVHSGLVNHYEEGDYSSVDLRRLTASPDNNPWGETWNDYQIAGIMDEVHDWRDTYGADLVALFGLASDVGGVAWLLRRRIGREDRGFSFTRVQQASWTYTHVHEMGHNMGCHHHKEQNVQPGPTNWADWSANNWSAGWRWEGSDENMYCSVMTYEAGIYFDDGINATRVPYFSNPDVEHLDTPTGHAADGDNARTLREVRGVVENYREKTSPERYTLTLNSNPDDGGIVLGNGNFADETHVNVAAFEKYNYKFVNWTDEDDNIVSEDKSFHFDMPDEEITLTANFASKDLFFTFNVKNQFDNPVKDANITVSPIKIGQPPAKKSNNNRKESYGGVYEIKKYPQKIYYKEKKMLPNKNSFEVQEKGEWIHWDDGENVNSSGPNRPFTFSVASRWEAEDIKDYKGKIISDIRFFPHYEDCEYTIKIWVGEHPSVAYSQKIEDIILEESNRIKLDTPFVIDASDELWFGLKVETEGGQPIGTDSGPAVEGKGNMIRWHGMWRKLTDLNETLDFNWNLHAFVKDIELVTDINGQANHLTADGFFVYNVKKDKHKPAKSSFGIEDEDVVINVLLELKTYNLELKANPKEGGIVLGEGDYPENEEVIIKADPAEGYEFINWTDTLNNEISDYKEFTFEMPDDNITLTANFEELVYDKIFTTQKLKIFPNPAGNKIFVEADQIISEIKFININGQLVKSVHENSNKSEVDIIDLPEGNYLIQVVVGDKKITEWIQITR